MSLFNIKATTLAALLTTVAIPADAEETIVMLSDNYPKEVAKELLGQVETLMGAEKQDGRLRIKDGLNTRTIIDVDVPAGEEGDFLLRNRSAWKRHFRPGFSAVTSHLKDAIAKEATRKPGGVAMQVNLQSILQELRYDADASPTVIIFGDLRNHDPSNPDFSTLASFPIGDHQNKPPSVTPFGARGYEGSLTGVSVHLCATSNEYISDAHRHGVERGAGQLITAFGAKLVTLSYDLRACVQRAITGATDNAPEFGEQKLTVPMGMVDGDKAAFVTRTTVDDSLELLKDIRGVDPIVTKDLRDRIKTGEVELHVVYVRDTHTEDGDVVTLISGSGSWDVTLRNKETRVIVPVENGLLRLRGKKDGRGGGITVAFRTEDNSVFESPVMLEGQETRIPFLKSGS